MMKNVSKKLGMLLIVLLIFVSNDFSVFADVEGSYIFGNSNDNRAFYERMVQLDNGDLLCTFMRNFPPSDWSQTTKSFYFYKSSDEGKTWSQVSELNASQNGGFDVGKQGMPGLFVLPQQLGEYPAGTILFATTDWSDNAYSIHIWRSTDQGQSWQYHSSLAARGQNDGVTKGNNTWEPEFAVSSDGRLVCYYSDERQIGYDQCIVREISSDGGITWGDYGIIVGDNDAPTGTKGWRPGMPRVLKLKNGNYFMAYENIHSNPTAAIRFKISSDGINWGNPSELGSLIATDHSMAFQCPEIALVDDGSVNGRIFVKGMNDSSGQGQCFTSTDNGATWEEMDAPLTAVRNESVGSSWSGTFVANGNVLYEINNYFNGSYNEIRFGKGVVYGNNIIVDGAEYKFINTQSRLCLDDAGGSTTAGTQMIQWTDNKLDTQKWIARYEGNGYFKFINKFSGLCLDNLNGLSTSGNPIIQWNDNGMDPQRWRINTISNNTYSIINKSSNMSMGVENNSSSAGSYIVQLPTSNAGDRTWEIERVYEITRFQSYNFPNNYMRHSSYRVVTNGEFTNLPIEDSYFRMVPALNGNTECVSFESVNMPGYYMRHRDGEVWFDEYQDTSLFNADASFYVRDDLMGSNDPQVISIEASNISGNYLRHQDGVLKLTSINSALDQADASFKMTQQ